MAVRMDICFNWGHLLLHIFFSPRFPIPQTSYLMFCIRSSSSRKLGMCTLYRYSTPLDPIGLLSKTLRLYLISAELIYEDHNLSSKGSQLSRAYFNLASNSDTEHELLDLW